MPRISLRESVRNPYCAACTVGLEHEQCYGLNEAVRIVGSEEQEEREETMPRARRNRRQIDTHMGRPVYAANDTTALASSGQLPGSGGVSVEVSPVEGEHQPTARPSTGQVPVQTGRRGPDGRFIRNTGAITAFAGWEPQVSCSCSLCRQSRGEVVVEEMRQAQGEVDVEELRRTLGDSLRGPAADAMSSEERRDVIARVTAITGYRPIAAINAGDAAPNSECVACSCVLPHTEHDDLMNRRWVEDGNSDGSANGEARTGVAAASNETLEARAARVGITTCGGTDCQDCLSAVERLEREGNIRASLAGGAHETSGGSGDTLSAGGEVPIWHETCETREFRGVTYQVYNRADGEQAIRVEGFWLPLGSLPNNTLEVEERQWEEPLVEEEPQEEDPQWVRDVERRQSIDTFNSLIEGMTTGGETITRQGRDASRIRARQRNNTRRQREEETMPATANARRNIEAERDRRYAELAGNVGGLGYDQRCGVMAASAIDENILTLEMFQFRSRMAIPALERIIRDNTERGEDNESNFRMSVLAAVVNHLRNKHRLGTGVSTPMLVEMGCNLHNCPIVQSGDNAGRRCWAVLSDNICPTHGDVTAQLSLFNKCGQLTPEQCDRLGIGYTNNED